LAIDFARIQLEIFKNRNKEDVAAYLRSIGAPE
jgi:hypothetical protein